MDRQTITTAIARLALSAVMHKSRVCECVHWRLIPNNLRKLPPK